MPYKDKEKQKEYQRKHYQSKKSKYSISNKNRKQRNLDYAMEHKANNPCSCGQSDVDVLEFHHRDPALKTVNVSILCRNSSSLSKLKEEIDKCDILCRNCHRMTYVIKRKDGSTKQQSRRNKIKDEINKVKSRLGCKLCEENRSLALDFHHKDPKEKFKDVFRMITQGYSLKAILLEIEKCDVLCANCHIKHHKKGY